MSRSSRVRAQQAHADAATRRATTEVAAVQGGPPGWIVALVLALAIGAVYGPARKSPLVFDDAIAITRNTSIRSLSPLIGTTEQPGPMQPPKDSPTAGRPLVNFSFAVNYAIGGLQPSGYHAVNSVIHFLSALMLWAIVRRMLMLPYFGGRFNASAGWLALLAALLWALHPLQTEAVIYATQRTELLMALCYLGTLYCSLRYWAAADEPTTTSDSGTRPSQLRWLTLATMACWCGMASKEVMVSAPLMVLLFDRAFVAGSLPAASRRSWPLYVGLASAWLLLVALNIGSPRSASAGFGAEVSLVSWWLTQAQVLLMYLKLSIWPHPLLFHYELPYLTPTEAWPYALIVLTLGLATLVLLWRNRPTGFLGTWVFVILAPTSVVPIVTEMAAERRMYLPLAAIAVAAVVYGAVLVQRWMRRDRARAENVEGQRFAMRAALGCALLLAVICGVASARQLSMYRDERLLWREVLKYQPKSYTANYSLGKIDSNNGQWNEASELLSVAAQVHPDWADPLDAYGLALTNTGQLPQAIETLEKAASLAGDSEIVHNNLGFALNEAQRYREAAPHLQKAVELMPNDAQAHNNLGISLANLGDVQGAIAHFRRALELEPDFDLARKNLNIALEHERANETKP